MTMGWWSSVFILAGGPKRSSDDDAGGCSRQHRCLPVAPDVVLFSGHECNRSNKDEGDGGCRWCVDLVGSLSLSLSYSSTTAARSKVMVVFLVVAA